VALGSALHDGRYYQQADAFLRYAVSKRSGMINGSGVLQEPCERDRDGCTGRPTYLDIISWKGILVQALSDYTTATGSTEFRHFIGQQAWQIVHDSIRTDGKAVQPGNCHSPGTCQFVFYWGFPLSPVRSGFVNHSTQMDALEALPGGA
jgi:hypothetical protein